MSEENVEQNDSATTGLAEIARMKIIAKNGTFNGTHGETMELQYNVFVFYKNINVLLVETTLYRPLISLLTN